MPLLDMLSQPEVWAKFYEYRSGLCGAGDFAKRLEGFCRERGYAPVCAAIEAGAPFPLPKKTVISKLGSQKKRTVYTYPENENVVLKLLTHLLLREYDGLFSPGLYSFRPGRTAKDAVRRLQRTPGIGRMWAYKVDIHDYFNSIPTERLLPMLEDVLAGDPALLGFLKGLLTEPFVLERGRPVRERKGIMAGTPQSTFYANLYLRALDERFAALGLPYARYSDDIILFAPTREQTEAHAAALRAFLGEMGLAVNPDKEAFYAPGEGWVFLGFLVTDRTVDVAPVTVTKLKGKMRRKRDALLRWQKRTGHTGEQAARAFIRIFNRKLLECAGQSELSWSLWFFSMITTVESLRVIDRYAQDCLRVLISGTHTKARFNVRYEDLKALGYRSLVHAYYDYRPEARPPGEP